MTTIVHTNNVPRDIIDGWSLTAKERAEFDYVDWAAIDGGTDSVSFVRYKGALINLHEFSTTWGLAAEGNTVPEWLDKWNGYLTYSVWTGLVIKLIDDGESAVIGHFVVSS